MINASELSVASAAYLPLRMSNLCQILVTYQIVTSSILPQKFHYFLFPVITQDTHFWVKVCAFPNDAPWKGYY